AWVLDAAATANVPPVICSPAAVVTEEIVTLLDAVTWMPANAAPIGVPVVSEDEPEPSEVTGGLLGHVWHQWHGRADEGQHGPADGVGYGRPGADDPGQVRAGQCIRQCIGHRGVGGSDWRVSPFGGMRAGLENRPHGGTNREPECRPGGVR